MSGHFRIISENWLSPLIGFTGHGKMEPQDRIQVIHSLAISTALSLHAMHKLAEAELGDRCLTSWFHLLLIIRSLRNKRSCWLYQHPPIPFWTLVCLLDEKPPTSFQNRSKLCKCPWAGPAFNHISEMEFIHHLGQTCYFFLNIYHEGYKFLPVLLSLLFLGF